MKNKHYLLSFLLILTVISLSGIYAHDDTITINNQTINIPEDYEVETTNESNFLLISEDSSTFIYINNNENVLDNYLNQNYTLTEEENFTINDKNIKEQLLQKENTTLYIYTLENIDNLNIIIKTRENNWNINNNENPLNIIINSLK